MSGKHVLWMVTATVLVVAMVMSAGCCRGRGPTVPTGPQAPASTVRRPPEPPRPPIESAPSEPVVRGVEFEPARDLEMIHFEFDKSRITEEARIILEKDAEVIKKNPDVVVQIEGHCDERGTNDYNLALGQRRATATRDYLINLGCDGSKLTTISYGEEKPLDPAHNEAAWAENRRAQFNKAQQ